MKQRTAKNMTITNIKTGETLTGTNFRLSNDLIRVALVWHKGDEFLEVCPMQQTECFKNGPELDRACYFRREDLRRSDGTAVSVPRGDGHPPVTSVVQKQQQ